MDFYFENGFYLDIGANDGVFKNKTMPLKKQGWSGICIEANPRVFPKLEKNRSCERTMCLNECLVSNKNSGKKVKFFISDSSSLSSGIIPDKDFDNSASFRWSSVGKVNNYCKIIREEYEAVDIVAKSLCNVLDDAKCPKIIEYVKFDIEGAEEEVLSDFCFEKYLFLFLVVELATENLYKNLCDNGFIYIGRKSEDDYFVNLKNPNISRYIEKDFVYSGGHIL